MEFYELCIVEECCKPCILLNKVEVSITSYFGKPSYTQYLTACSVFSRSCKSKKNLQKYQSFCLISFYFHFFKRLCLILRYFLRPRLLDQSDLLLFWSVYYFAGNNLLTLSDDRPKIQEGIFPGTQKVILSSSLKTPNPDKESINTGEGHPSTILQVQLLQCKYLPTFHKQDLIDDRDGWAE